MVAFITRKLKQIVNTMVRFYLTMEKLGKHSMSDVKDTL